MTSDHFQTPLECAQLSPSGSPFPSTQVGDFWIEMRIGELSKATGVSVPTIRLYEKEGLIGAASRTVGHLREFTNEHERRLRFIKRMRDLGFPLDDVKALLSLSGIPSEESSNTILSRISEGVRRRQADLALLERCLDAGAHSGEIDWAFEG